MDCNFFQIRGHMGTVMRDTFSIPGSKLSESGVYCVCFMIRIKYIIYEKYIVGSGY